MPKNLGTNGKAKTRRTKFVKSRVPGAVRTITRTPHSRQARLLGRYIIADPKVCYGKPTFRGTRIMVWQVLEMVSEGMAWESIVDQWDGSISKDAIAEAVQLAYKSFVKHADEFVIEPITA